MGDYSIRYRVYLANYPSNLVTQMTPFTISVRLDCNDPLVSELEAKGFTFFDREYVLGAAAQEQTFSVDQIALIRKRVNCGEMAIQFYNYNDGKDLDPAIFESAQNKFVVLS